MGDIVAKRIGELLVDGGVLSQSQLEQALFAQRKDGRKLGQLLIELGLVSEIQLTQTLSRQLSVPWVSLYHVDFSRSLLNMIPKEIVEKYCLVPIFVRRVRKQGETLYVAMDDPTNEAAIAEGAALGSFPVKPMIACPCDIRAAIRGYYLGEAAPTPSPQPLRAAPPPPPARADRDSRVAPPPQPNGARARPGASGPELAPPLTAVAPVAAVAVAAGPPAAPAGPTGDRPEPASEAEPRGTDATPPQHSQPRMISVTLVDGTSIQIPAPPKKRSSIPAPGEPKDGMSDQLTARDLVSALRAVSHGVDASEILGEEPKWEALFSVLLSILLRKGLIADWEFVEEFRKL